MEKREEATRRFKALLDLKVRDDELSAAAKFQKRQKPGRAAGAAATPTRAASATAQEEQHPLQQRIQGGYQIRYITGLEPRGYYYASQNRGWGPSDYGQSRMAALGWLLAFATRESKQDDFIKVMKDARDKSGPDGRPRWDWLYLQLVRQDEKETWDAAKALSQAADPAGQ